MPTRRMSSRISRRVRSRSVGSRLESGSSSSSTRGSGASARASATRCCCPPESWSTRRRSNPARSTSASARATRSRQLGAADAEGLQAEAHVLAGVEVGEQRVVLEHHPEPPVHRLHPGHVLAFDQDPAGVRRLEPRQQPQHRGLAAAARPQQRQHLARGRARASRRPPRPCCRTAWSAPRRVEERRHRALASVRCPARAGPSSPSTPRPAAPAAASPSARPPSPTRPRPPRRAPGRPGGRAAPEGGTTRLRGEQLASTPPTKSMNALRRLGVAAAADQADRVVDHHGSAPGKGVAERQSLGAADQDVRQVPQRHQPLGPRQLARREWRG